MKNNHKMKPHIIAAVFFIIALLVIISSVVMHLLTEAYDIIIMLLLSVFVVISYVFYITLKKTINSLKEAKEEADSRTRIIVNSTPRVCILFDGEHNLIDCNPATTELMGFETKEETLAGFIERVTETTLAFQSTQSGKHSYSVVTDWLAAAARDGDIKFETEMRIKGVNHILIVEMKKVPYKDSYAIVGYAHDITSAREKSKELAHVNELSKQQLIKLNLMIKGSKIGLWDMNVVKDDPVNPNNTITWSDEFRHMLGYKDEQDFPNLISIFNEICHPDDIELVATAITSHLLDKTGMTPYNIEYRIKKKNGEYGYFHAMGETIRDDEGNPVYSAGSLIDITENKSLIQEVTRQKAEAVAANKAKSSFLSTMSHEIRTPMNAILGITEILLLNESLTPDVREAIEKIYTSGDLLLGIINNILDLSKIEAGKLELVIDRYSTASLISDSVQLNVMQIGSKLIKFELQINGDMPSYLKGDVLRVKQILNNLLSNAFKYTAKGTVTLSVGTENKDDELILVLQVKDTGQGMTKEQVEKLFNEFARFNMETNRTIEGTGLGMSITRNLIKLMNGEIFISSEPEKGSAFTVRLPQGKISDEILGEAVIENLKLFRSIKKKSHIKCEPMPYGSVLIADDMDTNIYVAKGLMSPYKLKMDSVISGFGAIEKVESGKVYDVIFMDHMMPKMDGIETVKKIRELGYKHPIVALTANAVLGNADLFLENGFDDFISKPIDMRQLNNILKKYIRDKQPPEVLEAVALEYAEHQENETAVKLLPPDIKIPGLDIEQGVARYDNNEAIYINILRAYTASLRTILSECENVTENDLADYKVKIHGIKGASLNIYAQPLAEIAYELEKAASAENYKFVTENNPKFFKLGKELAENLENLLSQTEKENPKPVKEKPDKEVLSELIKACELYDIDEVDKAVEKLEKYQYESDNGLMDWLKEKLALMQYAEIIERLKGET